jgi:hypothetical protein
MVNPMAMRRHFSPHLPRSGFVIAGTAYGAVQLANISKQRLGSPMSKVVFTIVMIGGTLVVIAWALKSAIDHSF